MDDTAAQPFCPEDSSLEKAAGLAVPPLLAHGDHRASDIRLRVCWIMTLHCDFCSQAVAFQLISCLRSASKYVSLFLVPVFLFTLYVYFSFRKKKQTEKVQRKKSRQYRSAVLGRSTHVSRVFAYLASAILSLFLASWLSCFN